MRNGGVGKSYSSPPSYTGAAPVAVGAPVILAATEVQPQGNEPSNQPV